MPPSYTISDILPHLKCVCVWLFWPWESFIFEKIVEITNRVHFWFMFKHIIHNTRHISYVSELERLHTAKVTFKVASNGTIR